MVHIKGIFYRFLLYISIQDSLGLTSLSEQMVSNIRLHEREQSQNAKGTKRKCQGKTWTEDQKYCHYADTFLP